MNNAIEVSAREVSRVVSRYSGANTAHSSEP
ncbi:Uncharacterised protein [Mycobacteroides abscessus subsp. abscessus]|nr:Uncharacterised protein [Mycobacteroides abscessus subsp. abscessus]